MIKLKNIDLPAALKERYGDVYDGTPVLKGFRDGSAIREPGKLIQKACFPTYEGRSSAAESQCLDKSAQNNFDQLITNHVSTNYQPLFYRKHRMNGQ